MLERSYPIRALKLTVAVFLLAGVAMNIPITLHETLENCQVDFAGANWCAFPVQEISTWGTSGRTGGQWQDNFGNAGPSLSPQAQYPPTPPTPPQTTQVIGQTQKFFLGAGGDPDGKTNFFTGMCVVRHKLESYTDHAERQNITTPVPLVYTPASMSYTQPACAAGQFSNP